MSTISIFSTPVHWTHNIDSDIAKTHALRGVPVCAVHEIDNAAILHGSLHSFQDHMKELLVNALAKEILSARLVEFTRTEDHLRSTTIYRARAFLLPDTDVQLLRLQGILK